MQIYKNEKDLTTALTLLSEKDKPLAAAFQKYGTPPMRKKIGGFPGLAQLLVSQQVSTAAAETIFRRFEEAMGGLEPENLLALDEATLSGCGISRPKQRYLRILSETVVSGALDLKKLDRADNETIYNTLVSITGIGPWTAECYLLFVLRRADMFPAGDLALQHGVRIMYGMDDKPSAEALADFAQRWQPYRGAAARLLWSFYNGEMAEMRAQKAK
jgi:DNA-3-methyladenine glycosylase II